MNYSITTNQSQPSRPYDRFWNRCVGAGRANEGLRTNWQEHLEMAVKHCGFKYLRFHGLFHDDMCVYKETEEGIPIYNWQYVHDLFDRMLNKGIKPFVELGFCPREIASVQETCFWWKGHGSPPNDYDKWTALVNSFVHNCIERYGVVEVRSWYFEVWNEPNLDFFFTGTKSEYFKLYKVSVETIKAIDPNLRVGGPATSNFVPDERFDGEMEDTSKHLTWSTEDIDSLDWKGVWIEDFLAFCEQNNLPMDFISTHPYPTDFAIHLGEEGGGGTRSRSADATRRDLQWLRDTIDKSVYPEAEIHLTEWNTSPASPDHAHDYIQAATYIVKANVESIGLVDSLAFWTFTDVFEEHRGGDTAFHGGFGMITFQGIPKPSFHAYRLLNQLGDELISQEPGVIITRDSKDGKLAALCYYYPPEISAPPISQPGREIAEKTATTGKKVDLNIDLCDLKPNATFIVELLDNNHGSAVEGWVKAGEPHSPGRLLTEELKSTAWATKLSYHKANSSGCFSLKLKLEPWSVLLVREM